MIALACSVALACPGLLVMYYVTSLPFLILRLLTHVVSDAADAASFVASFTDAAADTGDDGKREVRKASLIIGLSCVFRFVSVLNAHL